MNNIECPQCGSPNIVQVDIDRYECPYCGRSCCSQEAEQAHADKVKRLEKQKKSNEHSGGKGIIMIAVALVIFLLLNIGGIVFYTLNKNESSSLEQLTEQNEKHETIAKTHSREECINRVEVSETENKEVEEIEAKTGENVVEDSDYEYDFVMRRIVTEEDIKNCSKKELRIMRNWIYARHGYKFKSQDLQEYFGQFSWYSPSYTDVSSSLSEIELKNVAFISRHE